MAWSTRSGFGLVAVFASCMVLVGCLGAGEKAPPAADFAAAEKAVTRLMEADSDADLATVLDCYTRDALLLAPDGSTFEGSDAIRAHYVDVFASLSMKLRATPAETVVAGNWAWQRGEVGGVLTMKDGTTQAAHDRYLMILALEDGRWRVARLMWQPLEKK
jgi:uncharacterized protein (TIGR02246 family)